MAAEIISSRVLPAQGQEVVVIMDDFGTEFFLSLAVSDASNRQAHVDAAIAQQSANQAAIESYAATYGIDLSAQLAAGLAKKEAAKKAAGGN